jgi:hypothetical protein
LSCPSPLFLPFCRSRHVLIDPHCLCSNRESASEVNPLSLWQRSSFVRLRHGCS